MKQGVVIRLYDDSIEAPHIKMFVVIGTAVDDILTVFINSKINPNVNRSDRLSLFQYEMSLKSKIAFSIGGC